VIPTAALMGRATEELAARSGPAIGGLMNVTFGNAPELIIAFFALNEGLREVVKASLIGSILGNTLLVMGAAMLVGGLPRDRQRFNATAANVTSLMLLLAVVALIMPAMFELVQGTGLPHPRAEAVNYDSDVERLSVGVALVLLSTCVAGLLFSMRTHRDLFNPEYEQGDHVGEPWTVGTSVITLAIAGAAVGVMSEILVGSITEASGGDRIVAVLRGRDRRVRRRLPDGVRVQRLRDRGRRARRTDRPAGHPRGRVDLVRGLPAARGIRGAWAHVLLRLMAGKISLHIRNRFKVGERTLRG
jgi:calcium/proton exchanger cax